MIYASLTVMDEVIFLPYSATSTYETRTFTACFSSDVFSYWHNFFVKHQFYEVATHENTELEF